jgi:hypothetical protein
VAAKANLAGIGDSFSGDAHRRQAWGETTKADRAGIGHGFSGDAHRREAWSETTKADLAGIGNGFSGDAYRRQAWGETTKADLTGIGNRDPTQGDRLHGGKLLNVQVNHFNISCDWRLYQKTTRG